MDFGEAFHQQEPLRINPVTAFAKGSEDNAAAASYYAAGGHVGSKPEEWKTFHYFGVRILRPSPAPAVVGLYHLPSDQLTEEERKATWPPGSNVNVVLPEFPWRGHLSEKIVKHFKGQGLFGVPEIGRAEIMRSAAATYKLIKWMDAQVAYHTLVEMNYLEYDGTIASVLESAEIKVHTLEGRIAIDSPSAIIQGAETDYDRYHQRKSQQPRRSGSTLRQDIAVQPYAIRNRPFFLYAAEQHLKAQGALIHTQRVTTPTGLKVKPLEILERAKLSVENCPAPPEKDFFPKEVQALEPFVLRDGRADMDVTLLLGHWELMLSSQSTPQ